MSLAFLVIGPGGEIAIYIHSSSVLKKKTLELKKEICKHLAEDSFNADDADVCSNV